MSTDAGSALNLPKAFIKLVERADLQSEPPNQYSKSWDNNGKPGKAQILQMSLVGVPCEVKFSLFFDGDDVAKTGVQIKFKDQVIVNEVLRGDPLGYMQNKSIDPVAYLKRSYGTPGLADALPPGATESFKLAANDDSEESLLRAIEILTGKTEIEIRQTWAQLISTNSDRLGKDRVSPFITIWLKNERLRLDLAHLKNADILTPRLEQNTQIILQRGNTQRLYKIATTRLTGADIRQLIGSADPQWWGPAFYSLQHGRLVKETPEQNEIENRVRKLGADMEYEVEEIFVDGRHIFSAVMEGQTRTMVWRPSMRPPSLADLSQAAMQDSRPHSRTPKSTGRPRPAQARSADPAESPAPEMSATDGGAFALAHGERVYIQALRNKTRDLQNHRKAFIKLLYESDFARFENNPDEMRREFLDSIRRAIKADTPDFTREKLLLDADIAEFFLERLPG